MTPVTAYIGLGSNTGDSHAIIERAIGMIASQAGDPATLRRSDIVVSEPWGFSSQNRFLNCVVSIDTCLEPLQLLDTLQSIERDLGATPHRDADGHYIDRNIDIDIIDIDGVTLTHPRLVIPHPHAAQRDFVTGPMRQLGRDMTKGT